MKNLSELASPVNQRILDHWRKICRGRPMPDRADLDPLDIPDLLPCIVLLDVCRDPPDFYYRLIGTQVAGSLNKDHTGSLMSQIPHQAPPSRIWAACWEVVETMQPVAADTSYVGRYHEFCRTEDVIMPLSKGAERPDMLLISIDHV